MSEGKRGEYTWASFFFSYKSKQNKIIFLCLADVPVAFGKLILKDQLFCTYQCKISEYLFFTDFLNHAYSYEKRELVNSQLTVKKSKNTVKLG